MVNLSDKKVQHLQDLIDLYYELDNEMEKADTASSIIGILNYVFDTDSISVGTSVGGCGCWTTTTYSDYIKDNDQEAGSSTC